MGYNIEKDLEKWGTQDCNMPDKTRAVLDETYSQLIQGKKISKSPRKWIKNITVVSMAVLVGIVLWQNETVLATLNEWFGFSHQWKQSLGDDVFLSNGTKQSDKNLEIIVEKNMSTPYSLGFDFTLKSTSNMTFSKDSQVWFDYTIKNGDGSKIIVENEEVQEKTDYTDLIYLQHTDVSVSSDGKALQSGFYYFLREPNAEKLPVLKNATLEVTKIFFPNENDEVVGKWSIPLKDGNPQIADKVKHYTVEKESDDITIKHATLTQSNFVIEYEFNKEMSVSDMELLNSYIQDETGRKYKTNQYSLENNNKTVRVNFPLTSSTVPNTMTLVVEEIKGDFKFEVTLLEE